MDSEKQEVRREFENKFIRSYFNFIAWMNQVIKVVGGFFLMVMSVSVFGSVFSRFFANLSWSWIEEGAVFMMVWVVMLGATMAVRAGHMIAVEALVMVLPKVAWKFIKFVVVILSIFYLFILIKAGIDFTILGSNRFSTTLPWLKMSWVYISIPICAALMILNMIANLIELLTMKAAK